ncbi:MAG: hypothetical protein WB988_12680 [Candidatus Nitrosopolaris sp.]
MRKQYDFKIKGAKVFGTCNEITRLSKPLAIPVSTLTSAAIYRRAIYRSVGQSFAEVETKKNKKMKSLRPVQVGRAVQASTVRITPIGDVDVSPSYQRPCYFAYK